MSVYILLDAPIHTNIHTPIHTHIQRPEHYPTLSHLNLSHCSTQVLDLRSQVPQGHRVLRQRL